MATGGPLRQSLGITSFGSHVPRLRLRRESAFEAMGWYAPEMAAYRKGERAFCNSDEDALTMAVEASRRCLRHVGDRLPSRIHLASTTLPYADRLNAAILKTALGLGDNIAALDITSSQRAGTAALLAGIDRLQAAPDDTVLVAAADQRLARAGSVQALWSGDGASALALGTDDVVATFLGSHTITRDFPGHYRRRTDDFDYTWEDRFIKTVEYPVIAEVVGALLDKLSLSVDDINHLVYPCYSPAEHRRIGQRLGIADKVADSLFDTVGETGAAHPLLMLANVLEAALPGDIVVAVGVGSGADALCFRVTEAIQDKQTTAGVSRAVANKQVETNYTVFLKHRNLLVAETGIRREAPQKTALSVLHREQAFLTGLIGGQCEACGTPQLPRTRTCVNPACRAVDAQTPYPFADRTAAIKTFTADRLGPSPSPPNLYGMVQFTSGGRMLAEFTDCRLEELAVGGPVRMCFRRRYEDPMRGFSGYFWKAVPLRGEEG